MLSCFKEEARDLEIRLFEKSRKDKIGLRAILRNVSNVKIWLRRLHNNGKRCTTVYPAPRKVGS